MLVLGDGGNYIGLTCQKSRDSPEDWGYALRGGGAILCHSTRRKEGKGNESEERKQCDIHDALVVLKRNPWTRI